MYRLIALLLLLFFISTITPALAQSPTPSPTDTPQASATPDEATVKLLDIIVSASVALIVALGGWLLQRRQFNQTFRQKEHELSQQQSQFREEMELERAKFQQQFPQQQLLAWLDNLDISAPGDIASGSPYVVGPPILDPRDFYGRQPLVAQFFEVVLGRQMTSMSVLGARRSGKTSFLHYATHPDTLHAYLKRHNHPIVPVYLNLQARVTGPESFYSYLVRATTRAFERHTQVNSGASDLPAEINYSFVEEFFDRACQSGWRFVLLLDEFEELGGGDVFDEDFFESLRALAAARNLAWVTTSFLDIYHLGGKVGLEPGSPFFNIFHPVPLYLGALSQAEATQLVTKPAAKAGYPFVDEDVTFVLTLAGRLPFAIQAASSILYQARRGNITNEAARDQTRKTFIPAMEKHFKHHWTYLTPDEHRVLQRLAQGGKLTSEDYTRCNLLADYGFVEAKEGDYYILGDAFAEWIRTVANK